MESKIDLMVKELAKSLKVEPPKPTPQAPPENKTVPENKVCIKMKDIYVDGVGLDKICAQLKNGGQSALAEGLAAVCELAWLDEAALARLYTMFKQDGVKKSEYLIFAAELMEKFNAQLLAEVLLRRMNRLEKDNRL